MKFDFTWTYAEASDDPHNTAHTDVAHEGKLRLQSHGNLRTF